MFIYFKDKRFFEEVVAPFIRNKFEKTFVDHFLLGNVEEVVKFARVEELPRLNSMEHCLLLLVLVSNKKYADKAQLLQSLIDKKIKS